MGADNMAASGEIILPRRDLGEKFKQTFKNLANRVGGQDVMQTTKLKNTATETKTRDTSKEDADKLIKKSSQQPPEKPKKPWIQRKVGKLTVGIGLGTLALGSAGYAARETISNNIPGISRPAEKPAPTLAPKENLFPFPLNPSSFATISQADEKSLWENTKTVDLENHTFTIGFPVDQDTINRSPNLRYNSYFEPSMFGRGVDTEFLEKAGMKNITQITDLPKDTLIYYSYDSTKFDASIIAITIAGAKSSEPTYGYTTLRVILRDKQTGKNFEGSLGALYAQLLVQQASYPKDHHPIYEDGTPIKPTEPILRLTTDLQDWDGKGQRLPGQKGQVIIETIGGGLDPKTSQPIFLSPKFLKDTNGRIVPSTNK